MVGVLICVCWHKKRKNKKAAQPNVETPMPPSEQREEVDAESVHIDLDDSQSESVRLDTDQPIAIQPVVRKATEADNSQR